MLYCRDTHQASSSQVEAVITAANHRLHKEVDAVRSQLQAQVKAVEAEAARSAARAKAHRQSSHIADRERLQEDCKEIASERWVLSSVQRS